MIYHIVRLVIIQQGPLFLGLFHCDGLFLGIGMGIIGSLERRCIDLEYSLIAIINSSNELEHSSEWP